MPSPTRPAILDESELRALSGFPSLHRLLVRMGFDGPGFPVLRADWESWGLRHREARRVRSLKVAATKGRFRVLLLELRGPLDSPLVHAVLTGRSRRDPAARELLIVATPEYRELLFAVRCADGEKTRVRKLLLQPAHPYPADVEALQEIALPPLELTAAEIGVRVERALDREQVTDRFFRVFRGVLDSFREHLTGGPPADGDPHDDAGRFCLLTLERLLFLYFIQKKGWLDRDRKFLPRLFRRCLRDRVPFHSRLATLFFGVLNTRVADRDCEAEALGKFPYLNGGLFEPDPVEVRHPGMALGDGAFAAAFERLLEKFRFTVREDPDVEREAGVDPEMLGKVFESLMDSERRSSSGSFYTPRHLVEEIVHQALVAHLERVPGLAREMARELIVRGSARDLTVEEARASLDSLERVRILDPACGSGAFLLGALTALERALCLLRQRAGLPAEPAWETRRRIIHRNLYGVDIEGTAVGLCSLRLWLALAVDLVADDLRRVPPLPNLDHKVKQGDSLLSPLDLVYSGGAVAFRDRLRRALGELPRMKDRYEQSTGPAKKEAAATLARRETDIARELLEWRIAVLDERHASLEAAARSTDLFGQPARLAPAEAVRLEAHRRQRAQLDRMRSELLERGHLPSLTPEIHFAEALADGGFDVVLGNPPWVRLHRIPEAVREALRKRYSSFGEAAWKHGADLSGGGTGFGGQVDLSALFVERALELVRSGGVVSFLVPSKLFVSLYGGGIRRRIAETASVLGIRDLSGAARKLFRADTFPLILTLRKERPDRDSGVPVRIARDGRPDREISIRQGELGVCPDDPASPWRLASEEVRRAFRKMEAAGERLRERWRPTMGHKTGANRIHVVEDCRDARRPGMTRVKTRGFRSPEPGRKPSAYVGTIERSAVRPLVRGEDLAAWRAASPLAVLIRDPRTPAPGLDRYLGRHGIAGRADRPAPASAGSAASGLVLWKDIAREMSACHVAGPLEGPAGPGRPVPLNTVSFVSATDPREGLLLAAIMNSTPARAYLASFAPRAKDGHFRFFCWTVALLPVPSLEPSPALTRLLEIARRLEASEGRDAAALEALDREVASLYGLTRRDLKTLRGSLSDVKGTATPGDEMKAAGE